MNTTQVKKNVWMRCYQRVACCKWPGAIHWRLSSTPSFQIPRTRGEEWYSRSHTRTPSYHRTNLIFLSCFCCLHLSGESLLYEPKNCVEIAVAYMLLHSQHAQSRIPAPELAEDPDEDPDGPPAGAKDAWNATGQRVRNTVVKILWGISGVVPRVSEICN